MARTLRHPPSPRTTWAERALVLCGFALAALCTAWAAVTEAGLAAAAAAWLAALVWAFLSSLALALRRGIRDGDWSAFRRRAPSDGRDDRMDWASKTGRYAYLRVAEEHRRLTLGY